MKQTSRNKSSANVFTGRTGNPGLFVMVVVAFLILFTAMSALAIFQQPESPAAWSMGVFSVLLLLIVLGFEDNVFPNLETKKLPTAIVCWFFGFMFAAFFVAFVTTGTYAYLTIALFFGLIIFLAGTYTLANEKQWSNFKENMANNTTRKVSKTVGKKLPKRKKRKKAKKKKTRIARW